MTPSSADFTVACIQNCAEDDLDANLVAVTPLLVEASAAGAELLILPEYFAGLMPSDTATLAAALPEEGHPVLAWGREQALRLQVWLLLGSFPALQTSGRVRNRSLLLKPDGNVAARYDKLHLFDVELANGERYEESRCVEAGTELALADLPWGRLGLSICYDVRFAYLYRALAQAGADYLSVPAAFTRTTGQAHWESLLRARAIETGSYVFAAGQCGVRHWGRATWGHSMIVDPWGSVQASLTDGPGYVLAQVERERVVQARRMIPALQHDRVISLV